MTTEMRPAPYYEEIFPALDKNGRAEFHTHELACFIYGVDVTTEATGDNADTTTISFNQPQDDDRQSIKIVGN